MIFPYDLHMHSCLSPCGDKEMTPNNIAGMAHLAGLKIIALADHNTGKNVPALVKAAAPYDLLVVPALELTTQEEVHVLCLFPEVEQVLSFGDFVYEKLMKIENKVDFFGEQWIMNENDEVIGEEPYLLINATEITFEESFPLVASYGGLAIPAHVDKDTTSVLSNLGFFPPDLHFPCAEIKDLSKKDDLLAAHPVLQHCHIISDSDAHALETMRDDSYTLDLPVEHPTAADVIHHLQQPL